jgi:hypothetical protein
MRNEKLTENKEQRTKNKETIANNDIVNCSLLIANLDGVNYDE